MDSNHGPLVSEPTALSTEPQPLPYSIIFTLFKGLTSWIGRGGRQVGKHEHDSE